MTYVKTREGVGAGEVYVDIATLAADLCHALGGAELDTRERGSADFQIGEIDVIVMRLHGRGQNNRVQINAAARAIARKVRSAPPPQFPRTTLDASRPLEAIVRDVRRRVLEASAQPLANLKAMLQRQETARNELASFADQIRAIAPAARVEFRDADSCASLYLNTNGVYVTGRIYPDGAVSLDRVGNVRGAHALQVIASLANPEGQSAQKANPPVDVVRELVAALQRMQDQVDQMRGMFNDEDGAIQNAVDDAEAAQTLAQDYLKGNPPKPVRIGLTIEGGAVAHVFSPDDADAVELTVFDMDIEDHDGPAARICGVDGVFARVMGEGGGEGVGAVVTFKGDDIEAASWPTLEEVQRRA